MYYKFMKTILADAVNAFIIPEKGIFKEMYALLEKYPNKKIILTNADKKEREKFRLFNLPYDLFTLEHNPNKTDPEYFKKMLKYFDLKPEDVVYFEHNKEVVKSAQSVGIKTFYYNKNKKDLVSLKKFIDENM